MSSVESLEKVRVETEALVKVWQLQADFMRKNGIVSAKWSGEFLVECIMGPSTTTETPTMTAEAYKVHLEELQRRAAEELERLDTGAS